MVKLMSKQDCGECYSKCDINRQKIQPSFERLVDICVETGWAAKYDTEWHSFSPLRASRYDLMIYLEYKDVII